MELKIPHSLTFSTNARDIRRYPDTNRFSIPFPNTVRNVVGISMQSMEMNLSQKLVRKEINDRLRFTEGLRLGNELSDSTTIRVQVGTSPSQTVWLPSYLNPILTQTTDGTSKRFTLFRPLGVASGSLQSITTVEDFFLVGYKPNTNAFPMVSFKKLLQTHAITVSADGKELLIADENDLLSIGEPLNKDGGDNVFNCFVYTPPLSTKNVIDTFNSQLDRTVSLYQVTSSQKLYFAWNKESLECIVSKPNALATDCLHALEAIGFNHNQKSRGGGQLLAKRRLPAFDAIVPPGNYDISGMAKQVGLSMNRGALMPISHNGYLMLEMHSSYQQKAVLLWQNERGLLNHKEIPDIAWFKSPYQLEYYLNGLLTEVNVIFEADPEKSTIHSISGRFKFQCVDNTAIGFVMNIRQISAYCASKNITNVSTEATLNLIQLLGFEQQVMPVSADITSTTAIQWPSHPRTWIPIYNQKNPLNNLPEIHQVMVPWMRPDRMFPTFRYVLSIDKKRPSQLTFLTTQDIIVTGNNTFAYDTGNKKITITPNTGLNTAVVTAAVGEPNIYVFRNNDDSTRLPILGYANMFDPVLNKHESGALSSGVGADLLSARCNIVPFGRSSRFGFYHAGVPNTINYRLGVSKEYPLAQKQYISQQFDLRPNHYFFVTLNNIGFTQNTNAVLIQNESDPTKTYEKTILARCVVSAPFVFDRGQSHSLTLAQPVHVNKLDIELLDEDGIHLFQTNKQEISFTFTFMRLIRP